MFLRVPDDQAARTTGGGVVTTAGRSRGREADKKQCLRLELGPSGSCRGLPVTRLSTAGMFCDDAEAG